MNGSNHACDAELAIGLAARWQAPNRWTESFWLSDRAREQEGIGWEKSRLANALRLSGYPREDVERITMSSQQAFEAARHAEDEIGRRHRELDVLRDILRTLAPEAMTLVPVVDFLGDPPADLLPFVERMIDLESRLLAQLASNGPPREADAGNTGDPLVDISGWPNMTEAAKEYGISKSKLSRWVNDDHVKAYEDGSQMRIDMHSLRIYYEKQNSDE